MINEIKIDGQDALTLKCKNSSATIIKSLGGTIYSINLDGTEVLAGDREEDLTKNDLFRGRLLFPFNDRIPQGKYSFEGNEYQFPLNCDGKDSIHGLIYNRDLELLSKEDGEENTSLTLRAVIKEGEFDGYPFDISMDITYKLSESDFSLDFKIVNIGEKSAPFALGWHPYFTFGKNINSANLKFSCDEYYDVDEDLYYEGNHYSVEGTDLDFSKGLVLGERELDIAISLKGNGEFELTDGDGAISGSFSKELFPCLQLFIPEDRNSIAVEPISAPSDTFNYPDTGLKVLKPKEISTGWVKIKSK